MATKTWTSKADWDGGTLEDLYCPIGLAQLEIAYDILTGKATYVFNAEKMVNWSSFGYTKENEATIWRDDFRVDSRARYSPANDEPDYNGANHRLEYSGTASGSKSGLILPATISVKNLKYQVDYYQTVRNDAGGPSSRLSARWAGPGSQTDYSSWHVSEGAANTTSILRFKPEQDAVLVTAAWKVPRYVWRTHHFELNDTSLLSYTDEGSMGVSDGVITTAGRVYFRLFSGQGWMDNVLVEHYTLPSPANNTMSVRFAISNDNVHWNPWVTDIANCGNSRYIKVEVTLSRDDLDAAMPVLKDMTLTYETRKQQPIFI